MKKIALLILMAFAFNACDEEVDIELPQVQERLVIEGRIELSDNPDNLQTIRLSKTDDFFNTTAAPVAVGAQVSVSDTRGNIYNYSEAENNPGTYVSHNLQAFPNETYTLRVEFEGDVYEASETIAPTPSIDSVYQVFEEENGFEDEGLRITIDFTDPADQLNFYYWEIFVDGETALIPDPGNVRNVVQSDEFFNGQKITGFQPNEEIALEGGESVLVKQIGLTKEAYDFYILIFEQTGKTGQLFDTPPAQIRGNIQNLTNPQNYPLGYFGASQVSERVLTIEPVEN